MSAPIHPRWKSTDSAPATPVQKSVASRAPVKRVNEVPVHHVEISGSGHRFFPALSVVFLSVILLAGSFLGGVQFLRASLLSDEPVAEVSVESNAEIPLLPSITDVIPEPQIVQNQAVDTAPPTIDISYTAEIIGSAWPSLLRVNSRTALSAIPSFAPIDQMPIHVIRDTERQVHSSAPARNASRSQPQTGSALWIIGFLSVLSIPFIVRKRQAF